jgi:hypothetical protein
LEKKRGKTDKLKENIKDALNHSKIIYADDLSDCVILNEDELKALNGAKNDCR